MFLIKLILKPIFKLIFTVILLVGIIAALLYFAFFNTKPAEYPYQNTVDQITSIEIAEISFENGTPAPTGMGIITDKEGFIADLNEIDCNQGIEISSAIHIANNKKFEGIIITYADGRKEIITAYISYGQSHEETNMFGSLYSFDLEQFDALLDEYKDLYVETDGNLLPDLGDIELPDLDGIELPEDLGN